MAVQRYISSSFWSDNWVDSLTVKEKLLYMHLLTNENTSICGVYKLTIKRMKDDTGICRDEVTQILKKFAADKKAFYVDEYIILPKWLKHQNLKNSKVMLGVKRALSALPKNIIEFLKDADHFFYDINYFVPQQADDSQPKVTRQSSITNTKSREKVDRQYPNDSQNTIGNTDERPPVQELEQEEYEGTPIYYIEENDAEPCLNNEKDEKKQIQEQNKCGIGNAGNQEKQDRQYPKVSQAGITNAESLEKRDCLYPKVRNFAHNSDSDLDLRSNTSLDIITNLEGSSENENEPQASAEPPPIPLDLKPKKIKTAKEIPKEAIALSRLLFTLHKEQDTGFYRTSTQLDKWAADIERLHKKGRSYEDIERTIRWVKRPGEFWFANIISGSKLHEKFDTVFMQMLSDYNRSPQAEKDYSKQDFSQSSIDEFFGKPQPPPQVVSADVGDELEGVMF